jgi:hypothetical protein
VDDHAQRVLAPVLDAVDRVQAGDAPVAELQASVASAAGALDNAHAETRLALERLDSDLEMIRFTVDVTDQASAVRAKTAQLLELIRTT